MNLEDIAITQIPALSPRKQLQLLELFGGAVGVFGASRAELQEFAQLNKEQADAILSRASIASAEREMEFCRRAGVRAIASCDAEFPAMLSIECEDYPHVIYTIGETASLARRSIAMVGTRRSSSYGEHATQTIISAMGAAAGDIALVSGLAYGIDSAVHRAAAESAIPTIAVVPSTLPRLSPSTQGALARKIINNGGCLLSERCSTANPHPKEIYTARNRIIAAISSATLIVESPRSGGSLITARLAREYSRPVAALPGRITDLKSAGCNELIARSLATSISSAEELFKLVGWRLEPKEQPSAQDELLAALSTDERGLLGCFRDGEPLSTAELMELTGLTIRDVNNLLFSLEMGGMVRLLPGNRYEPT